MLSFYNLSGLKVEAQPAHHGFAGQITSFPVALNCKTINKPRFALEVKFDNKKNTVNNYELTPVKVNTLNDKELIVDVPYYFDKRGRFSPSRLKISSEYCLGLFVAWTRLELDVEAIIYPKIKVLSEKLLLATTDNTDDEYSNNSNHAKGNDEFYELKNHVLGESISRVAWKQFAKGQGKFTKHYQQNNAKPHWLLLEDIPANTLENKLSILCYLIIEYAASGQEYGINLGKVIIQPSNGQAHKKQCLTALADY